MKKKDYVKPLTEVFECVTVGPLQTSGKVDGMMGMQNYFENPFLEW